MPKKRKNVNSFHKKTKTTKKLKQNNFCIHISEGDLCQQQEANRVRLRGVTVVCTLRHHVGKVHTFAKHVTSLREVNRKARLSVDKPNKGENDADVINNQQ